MDARLWDTVFGDRPVRGTGSDLLRLLDEVDPAAPDLPSLYLCCGTEDTLYEDNVRFRDAARARGVPVSADFGPGKHEWGYWDTKIQDVLRWLPLPRPAGTR